MSHAARSFAYVSTFFMLSLIFVLVSTGCGREDEDGMGKKDNPVASDNSKLSVFSWKFVRSQAGSLANYTAAIGFALNFFEGGKGAVYFTNDGVLYSPPSMPFNWSVTDGKLRISPTAVFAGDILVALEGVSDFTIVDNTLTVIHAGTETVFTAVRIEGIRPPGSTTPTPSPTSTPTSTPTPSATATPPPPPAPAPPPPTPTPTATLTLSGALNFGTATIAAKTGGVTVTVNNVSNVQGRVTGFVDPDHPTESFQIVSGGVNSCGLLPFNLAANANCQITLRISTTRTQTGNFSGQLRVAYQNGVSSVLTAGNAYNGTLVGTAVLTATNESGGTALDFGNVGYNQDSIRVRVNLTNSGASIASEIKTPLNVTMDSTGTCGAYPFVVGPNQSCYFFLTFRGVNPGLVYTNVRTDFGYHNGRGDNSAYGLTSMYINARVGYATP